MSQVQSRRIFTAEDARRIARRRLPRMAFDFIEGAAGREASARENETAFDAIKLQPRVMAEVAERSIATRFLGRDYDAPFGISPMGMCALADRRADRFLAETAREFGAPVGVSSAGSGRYEDMLRWSDGRAWFQLYHMGGEAGALSVVDRVKAAGCETLVLTVDVPQVSRRARDLRNGLVAPFRLTPRNFTDLALHPWWSLPMAMAGAPSPQNLPEGAAFDRGASRAGANWAFLAKLRDVWRGDLIVKGVTDPGDATRVRDMGADAIWVSTHGGRQLDAAPPAITLLAPIRAAVGEGYPLIFDSGVRSGDDVVRALALGADFVMAGRPWLYAIGAEGERGVKSLFGVIAEEVSTVLAQIGLNDVNAVSADVLAPRPVPEGAAT